MDELDRMNRATHATWQTVIDRGAGTTLRFGGTRADRVLSAESATVRETRTVRRRHQAVR
ncbi:hypothetical protein RVV18_002872 [Burkholderia ambifaria]|uniref:hypothetical protein n=1 Tax=Burkholderia sp. 567 TaxID=3156413 RepID=UPI0028DF77A2|nr:hypothetical protein [Burkholderia ambifaria]